MHTFLHMIFPHLAAMLVATFKECSASLWSSHVTGAVDRVLGHDAQHLIKRLCDQIAMKWEKSHSELMVWVRARIA